MVRPVQPDEWRRRGLDAVRSEEVAASARLAVASGTIRVLPGSDIHVIRLTPGVTEADYCRQLMATGLYEFAAPDWIVYPLSGQTRPDDPMTERQWHLNAVRAPMAWNAWTGDGGITCAFVDTGIDLANPDFAPLLVPGYNAASNVAQSAGGQVSDVNGHGTSVAGVAVGMGNNRAGGSGVCWTAKIMPIRATNYASGSAFMSNILYGASWAAFNGARVVSVSYAGVEHPSVEPTGQVIRNSYGGLLVWAAGNTSSNLSTFDYEATTVVGGINQAGGLSYNTNYGRAIDVMAPGVSIWVPVPGGGYIYRDGTSFAGPIAAGVLALAWSAAPTMTPNQAMQALYQSCTPLEPVHEFNNTGWGLVNAVRAVEIATGRPVPREREVLPAMSIPPVLEQGLDVAAYRVLGANRVPLMGGPPIWTGVGERIGAPDFGAGVRTSRLPWLSYTAVKFTGLINIPSTGVYTFTVASRDGSRLIVDGRIVVLNDGLHDVVSRSGTVLLERGLHRVECQYFTSTANPSLAVTIRGNGLGEIPVTPAMFFRSP
ncbi:MAG: S8 family serine peptidase [Phycisphaeraceae bacterium]|nr:S8 family serine peptidase [Phycisphaeraceae bacterium]